MRLLECVRDILYKVREKGSRCAEWQYRLLYLRCGHDLVLLQESYSGSLVDPDLIQ